MTTVEVGGRAEQAAASYLAARGFDILEMNYRRKHCEIDVVACKADVIYFVEVKYRATDRFGGGLDYIVTHKLHHMQRGAETWVSDRRWCGEYALSAIEVGGPDFTVLAFIESVY